MKIMNHLDINDKPQTIISQFLKVIGLGKITRHVNFKRRSALPLAAIISWLMTVHFARRSLYRAHPDQRFSIRTARNVLNDGRINWQKLVVLIARALINWLKPFIDQRRRLAFILDDTLMARPFSKQTELLARTRDHDKGVSVPGYRGLTLGWSDGNTFLPVNFAMMSTRNPRYLIGRPSQIQDCRTIAGQRRHQARRPMSDVAVELIKQALRLGIRASYVLFDSWYSSPKMFWRLKALRLNGLGMLKRSSKVYYRYRGRQYSIKALYRRFALSKMSRKNHYLYSSVVEAHYQNHLFKLKVVFVAKKGQRNQYLVLATTQLALRPTEIVQLYARRWQIETYFKAAKQYLALNRSRIQNYDGQCGYVAVTMITYDLLAWQERLNTDDRTIGGIFYQMNDAMPEIQFIDALVYLMYELSQLDISLESQIEPLIDQFIHQLPINVQTILKPVA